MLLPYQSISIPVSFGMDRINIIHYKSSCIESRPATDITISATNACSTLTSTLGVSSKNLSASAAFPPQALSKAKNAKCPPTTGLAKKSGPGNPPSPSVS